MTNYQTNELVKIQELLLDLTKSDTIKWREDNTFNDWFYRYNISPIYQIRVSYDGLIFKDFYLQICQTRSDHEYVVYSWKYTCDKQLYREVVLNDKRRESLVRENRNANKSAAEKIALAEIIEHLEGLKNGPVQKA
jgi:hypothetical protein